MRLRANRLPSVQQLHPLLVWMHAPVGMNQFVEHRSPTVLVPRRHLIDEHAVPEPDDL